VAAPFQFQGMIPRSLEGQQAVDIVSSQGQMLSSEALTQMLLQGTDISNLNPAPSDIWQEQSTQRLDKSGYSLGLPLSAEGKFINNTNAVVGEYRFIVDIATSKGPQEFQVLLSMKGHNVLLRKALLEKLGYKIENVQWLAKLRVHFDGHASVNTFVSDVIYGTNYSLKDASQNSNPPWIVNNTVGDLVDFVDLQDVILLPANPDYYPLESGLVPSEVIQGRRVLNSLLVPFALLDVPASILSFQPVAGRVVNNAVYLPYEWATNYSLTYQDAQWIAKKILKLTEQDWAEIANAYQAPPEIIALLLERLKARRNSLRDLLELRFPDLSFHSRVSLPPNLVDGQLKTRSWPGYASTFSFGNPENPLSTEEVVAFLRSKAVSSLLNSAVASLNTQFNDNRDVQKSVSDHVLKNLGKILVSEFVHGKSKSIPLGMYAIPSYAGNLLLSREVVVGSYLGTDNRIQMADTMGFQLTPGAFVGIDGLPGKVSETGNFGLQIQRSYTHIRPVQSVQLVNKTPFKNIIIPLLQRRWGQDLTDAKSILKSGEIDLEAVATALDKDLGIGESLIITDSLSTQESLGLTYPTSPSVSAQVQFSQGQVVLRRMQIYKVDKYNFQIYDDPGRIRQGSTSLGFNASGVPVLNFNLSAVKGRIKSHLYKLCIGDQDSGIRSLGQKNYEQGVRALTQVLMSGSLESLKHFEKSDIIEHEFAEHDFGFGFLIFQYRNAKVKDRVHVSLSSGSETSILYRSTGDRTGKDYSSLMTDILTSLLQKKLKNQNLSLDNTSSGNPADTLYGSSVSRKVQYEGVQAQPDNPNSVIKSDPDSEYASINHTHKGWNISQAEALRILKKMNRQFGVKLVDPVTLSDSRNILLYSVSLEINIYKAGIRRLAGLSPQEVRNLFSSALKISSCQELDPDAACLSEQQNYETQVSLFMKSQTDYLQALTSNGPRAADMALDLVNVAEAYFPGQALVNIVGAENVFITVNVDGFRDGDEQGDKILQGSTRGWIGANAITGPLAFLQQHLNAIGGEFLLTWLMSPL
jgi:hypothetical protein